MGNGSAVSRLWYAVWHWLCARYYERITLLYAEPLLSQWGELAAEASGRRMWLYQGVPRFPEGAWLVSLGEWCVLAPVVLAGALLNVMVWNGLFHRALAPQVRAFRETVRQNFSHS